MTTPSQLKTIMIPGASPNPHPVLIPIHPRLGNGLHPQCPRGPSHNLQSARWKPEELFGGYQWKMNTRALRSLTKKGDNPELAIMWNHDLTWTITTNFTVNCHHGNGKISQYIFWFWIHWISVVSSSFQLQHTNDPHVAPQETLLEKVHSPLLC